MAQQIDFRFLRLRLVTHLKEKVRNGELTERSLARLAGLSQPHAHNVLKGVRVLSGEMADRILQRLHLDLLDLLALDEVPTSAVQEERPECRDVPLLDGWVGPGHPYPERTGQEKYAFATPEVEPLQSPVAARLGPDPRMEGVFKGGDVVLLDSSEPARISFDEYGYYALEWRGEGAIRLVRLSGRHLYVLTSSAEDEALQPIGERDLAEHVRGRVRLLVRRL
jgi:transcriptional regulator with XRE-family HTH domain